MVSADLQAKSSSVVIVVNNDGMGSADEPPTQTDWVVSEDVARKRAVPRSHLFWTSLDNEHEEPMSLPISKIRPNLIIDITA